MLELSFSTCRFLIFRKEICKIVFKKIRYYVDISIYIIYLYLYSDKTDTLYDMQNKRG